MLKNNPLYKVLFIHQIIFEIVKNNLLIFHSFLLNVLFLNEELLMNEGHHNSQIFYNLFHLNKIIFRQNHLH